MNNMNNETLQAQTGLNQFFAKIYGFMALAIGVSAATSFLTLFVFPAQVSAFVSSFPLGFMGLWLVEIALVIILGMKAEKNPSLAIGGIIAFAIVNGIVLSFTLAFYSIGSVASAFATAAITFGAMAVFGAVTKRNLSGIGQAAMSALIGVIVAMLLNVFVLHSSAVEVLLSILMVFIFAGLTAYDNQRIRAVYYQSNGTAGTGIAVYMALQLYLDFINLFLAFLRLFGKNN